MRSFFYIKFNETIKKNQQLSIASYYRQLFADIKMKNYKIKTGINFEIFNLTFVENTNFEAIFEIIFLVYGCHIPFLTKDLKIGYRE